jgi:UDP-N-acetylglucosamine 2-epimerase (non-hydrolysing)
MNKLKVISVVGTRPEIIRLSRIFCKLDSFCDHKIIHTGQNYDYELNQVFYDDLEIRKPDYFLNCSTNETSAIQTIGNIFISLDEVLRKEQPDAFLVLGDTNSCLSAIVAKRHKVPIFHMEAGNRCFDLRVPEEVNRKIIDHVADINLTYSEISRDYLLREGLDPNFVIKTGSPMAEVLSSYRDKIERSVILEELGLSAGAFFLISVHREENIEPPVSFDNFIYILNQLAKEYGLPVVVSTHPRTAKKIEHKKVSFHPLVKLLPPFSFSDYNKLQISSKAVLSDSGTISEEASILNIPAINLRETHERPEAMEEASVIMTAFNFDRINQSLKILESQTREEQRSIRIVADYNVENVSDKIVRIIHSYTDYVNREVWKK